ncbi:hypothetical protein [Streptobacillus notomytis]|uniref:hypothetical protein n=1 Tax=Streptobacillus notomytis TaxID=1712031 RepID=UPI0009372005|nr:hypothetical protein [Streptobacillus notomytis]
MSYEQLFLKDLDEYKKVIKEYNDKKNRKKICGEQALKPNLYENICFDVYNIDNENLNYYFKFSDDKIVKVTYDELNKNYNIVKKYLNERNKAHFLDTLKNFKNLKETFPENYEKNTEKNTVKLILVSLAIVIYYSKMLKYFQHEISKLDMNKLYNKYDELEYRKVENLLRYITTFYVKTYYKYPLNEIRETSEIIDYLMEHYNIDKQMEELTRNLTIIKDAIFYQIQKKEEKLINRREYIIQILGIVFTILGLLIGFIQIYQVFN